MKHFCLTFKWPLLPDQVNEAPYLLPTNGDRTTFFNYQNGVSVALYGHGGTGSYLQSHSFYGPTEALPVSEYLDTFRHHLVAVSCGSMHLAGLTDAGALVSCKSHYGTKKELIIECRERVESFSAGTYHLAAVSTSGTLFAWPVHDCAEAHAAVAAFVNVCNPAAALPEPGDTMQMCWPDVQGKVTMVASGAVHTLFATDAGCLYLTGNKVSERFTRSTGAVAVYNDQVSLVQLPVPHRAVLRVAAGSSRDVCIVATDAGVCCWHDQLTSSKGSEQSWAATYAPAPRHLPMLDGLEVVSIAISDSNNMAAVLTGDGRVFAWFVAKADESQEDDVLVPRVVAVAPGATALGWIRGSLLIGMPRTHNGPVELVRTVDAYGASNGKGGASVANGNGKVHVHGGGHGHGVVAGANGAGANGAEHAAGQHDPMEVEH